MIKAENLTKSFGDLVAVKDVNLHIGREDIFGLVGPDGAGKTTLMRMACGLITPDAGQIGFLPDSQDRQRQAGNVIGYMPQRFSLYGDLTVMENINFFGALYKISRPVIEERAREILALTGLLEFTHRLADNLSGGMKQKLALTCALVIRPGILILDEPTYGVDPESRKEFWKILYHLNRSGITLFISTPYMDEAELCKNVAFMNRGKIRVVDTPLRLKANFRHQVLEVRVGIREPDIFNGLPGVADVSFYGDKYRVVTEDVPLTREAIRDLLNQRGIGEGAMTCQAVAPSMEEIFVSLAEKEVV